MASIRLHLLPVSLLSVVVSAVTTGPYTNSSSTTTSSSSFSHTHSGCDHCTVTALEVFHTYPHSVEVESITATNVVVPMVTVHPDGRLETNYVTETQSANPTAPSAGGPVPSDADPYAKLTWEYAGVTMKYPTTYVQFFDLSGGTFYSIEPVIEPTTTATCTYNDQTLELPTNSATGLIIPLPSGVSVNPEAPTAISAPPQIHSYLDSFPAVSSQFGGTPVASCAWTKIANPLAATEPAFTEVVPVAKVSVSVLTEVTAQQVLITPTGNNRDTQTTTLAIAHPEVSDTVLVTPPGNTPAPNNNNNPPPANNNPPAQQQQGGSNAQNTPGVGGAIASLFDPTFQPSTGSGGGSNGGNGGGVNVQAIPSVGASGGATQSGGAGTGNAQQSGSAGTGTAQSGGQGGQSNGQNGGGLPAPLVVVLGGTPTTVAPTVVRDPGSTGSVTAFVLGPGSTLLVGGSPITVSGTAVSAPGGTTTGGVGGAIASGLGYTGPLASDNLASTLRGPNLPMGMLVAAGGVLGALAIGL